MHVEAGVEEHGGVVVEARYWAFISYSHRDAAWARWLQRRLETYRLPTEWLGRQTPAGPMPARLYPAFRDEEDLAAGELVPGIRQALAESRTLIVICSPHSSRSRYVNDEIQEFARLGRANRVFGLIVDGIPRSGDEDECLPPSLRSIEDGGVGALALAADIRDRTLGRNGAFLKLIAGVIGVRLDELRKRDARRRRRSLWLVIAAALAVLGVVGWLAVAAVTESATAKRNEKDALANKAKAREQEITAIRRRAEALRNEGVALGNKVAWEEARARQIESFELLRTVEEPGPVSVLALWNASFVSDHSVAQVVRGEPAVSVAVLDETQFLVVTENGKVATYDLTGRLVRSYETGITHVVSARTVVAGDQGGIVALASAAGVVQVSSLETGRELCRKQSTAKILAATVSNDGRQFAWIDFGGGFGVARVDTCEDVFTGNSGEVSGWDIAISPSGRYLATPASLAGINLWDIEEQQLVKNFPGSIQATAIQFADDETLFVAGLNGHLSAFEWRHERNRFVVAAHSTMVHRMWYAPKSARLLTAGGDGTVAVWNATDGSQLRRFHSKGATSVSAAPSGEWAVATNGQGVVVLALEANAYYRWVNTATGEVPKVAITRDGGLVAIADRARISIRDADSGKELLGFTAFDDGVKDLAFSPTGERLVVAGNNYDAGIWDIMTGRKVESAPGPLSNFQFLPDGHIMATASGAIVLLDEHLQRTRTVFEREGPISIARMSPDGTLVLIGDASKTVTAIDVRSGRVRYEHDLPTAMYVTNDLQFSTKSDLAVAVVGGVIWTWKASDGSQVTHSPVGGWYQAFLLPGDSGILAQAHTYAAVLDVASKRELFGLGFNRDTIEIAVADDATRVVRATSGLIEIWNPGRARRVLELEQALEHTSSDKRKSLAELFFLRGLSARALAMWGELDWPQDHARSIARAAWMVGDRDQALRNVKRAPPSLEAKLLQRALARGD